MFEVNLKFPPNGYGSNCLSAVPIHSTYYSLKLAHICPHSSHSIPPAYIPTHVEGRTQAQMIETACVCMCAPTICTHMQARLLPR